MSATNWISSSDGGLITQGECREPGLDIRFAAELVGDFGWAGRDGQRGFERVGVAAERAQSDRLRDDRAGGVVDVAAAGVFAREGEESFERVGVAACRADAGEVGKPRELFSPAKGSSPSSVSSGSPSHCPIATLAAAIITVSVCSHWRLPRSLASVRPGSAIATASAKAVLLQRHVGEVVVVAQRLDVRSFSSASDKRLLARSAIASWMRPCFPRIS